MRGAIALAVCLIGCAAPTTRIRYLANEGVLIEAGERRVLIDGLHRPYKEYAVLPEEARRALETAAPPWPKVDLVLVSHRHLDHFHPEAVVTYLQHAPGALLLTSEQVVGELARVQGWREVEPRVRAVRAGETATVAGIRVTFLALSHGELHPTIQNLGHLIEIGGVTLLHVGDAVPAAASFAPLGLERRRIDVAFLPWWFLADDDAMELVRRHIAPRRIVAVHIAPGEAEEVLAAIRGRAPEVTAFVNVGEDEVTVTPAR